jgi:hypothetical protein
MSVLEKYLAGWTFRTKFPDFEPGEEIEVMVTGSEDGEAKARIGDSVLRIHEAPGNLLHKRVTVEITEWDSEGHMGEGTYIETVGESSF